jgi:hypothetical protein
MKGGLLRRFRYLKSSFGEFEIYILLVRKKKAGKVWREGGGEK